jgi:hypothetical protein
MSWKGRRKVCRLQLCMCVVCVCVDTAASLESPTSVIHTLLGATCSQEEIIAMESPWLSLLSTLSRNLWTFDIFIETLVLTLFCRVYNQNNSLFARRKGTLFIVHHSGAQVRRGVGWIVGRHTRPRFESVRPLRGWKLPGGLGGCPTSAGSVAVATRQYLCLLARSSMESLGGCAPSTRKCTSGC